jgi:excisionase family DNA binding protein
VNEISVKEAAAQLGVSEIQVGRLIGFGELRAQRFGRSWAVDRASVQRYLAMRSPKGRPLPPESAWRHLLAAQPMSIDDASNFARRCRRRGSRVEGAIGLGKVSALLADRRIAISGVAAAARHGAAVDENPPHVIYVKQSDFDSLAADYRMSQAHSSPNLVAWVVADACWPFNDSLAPPAVALIDLVGEGDIRSARELLSEINR